MELRSILILQGFNLGNYYFLLCIIYYTMESGRMMLVHSLVIGVLLYLFMIFVVGQKQAVAENRSILIAALVLVYMILFGHGLPTSINKSL